MIGTFIIKEAILPEKQNFQTDFPGVLAIIAHGK